MASPPTPATWSDGFVDENDFNTRLRDMIEFLLDPPRIETTTVVPGQSLPNQTETAINFSGEAFKVDFTHSTVSNQRQHIVTVDGLYVVGANIEISASGGSGQRRVSLYLNGSSTGSGGTIIGRSNTPRLGTPTYLSAWGMARAVTGDWFQAIAYQSSGETLTIAPSSRFYAYFVAA